MSSKSEIIISPSGKYKMTIFEVDKNTPIKCTLTKVSDMKIIYEYQMMNTSRSLHTFMTLNNQEWWFGGRMYMLKLFINLDTEQIYDDPNKREQSNSFECGMEFIWNRVIDISPDNKKILIGGCVWAQQGECRLYDISDLANGYKPFDKYEFFDDIQSEEHIIIDEEFTKYHMPEHESSSEFNYKFINNHTIGQYKEQNLIKEINIDE
jgi:hypothetical protein